MLNTGYPQNTDWYYDEQKNGFTILAITDIKKNDELIDYYGKKCNYKFFLYYGFINLDNNGENPKNKFPLSVELNPEDPGYDIKKGIVFYEGMENILTDFKVHANGHMNEKIMENILSWVRFRVFDGDS